MRATYIEFLEAIARVVDKASPLESKPQNPND
jgi:hypothetical protein